MGTWMRVVTLGAVPPEGVCAVRDWLCGLAGVTDGVVGRPTDWAVVAHGGQDAFGRHGLLGDGQRLLTGQLKTEAEVVEDAGGHHAALQLATLDQGRKSLDPNATLKEVLTGGGSDTLNINGVPKHVIGYMKDFLFTPEQARPPAGNPPGGATGPNRFVACPQVPASAETFA